MHTTRAVRSGRNIVINQDRWLVRSGMVAGGDFVVGYRQYVINHEVGHWLLDIGHQNVPGRWTAITTMQQQTLIQWLHAQSVANWQEMYSTLGIRHDTVCQPAGTKTDVDKALKPASSFVSSLPLHQPRLLAGQCAASDDGAYPISSCPNGLWQSFWVCCVVACGRHWCRLTVSSVIMSARQQQCAARLAMPANFSKAKPPVW